MRQFVGMHKRTVLESITVLGCDGTRIPVGKNATPNTDKVLAESFQLF